VSSVKLFSFHVGRFPYAAAHLALHRQDLLRHTPVQRSQKAPQRALGRQPHDFQHTRQNRIPRDEPQLIQATEPDIQA
jgi:hypothetical protein